MAKRVVQNNTRSNVPIHSKPVIENKKVIIQNKKREFLRIPSFSSSALLSQIKSFTMATDKNYYLGFGGLGDALLLLAACWNDPRAKVVFFANQIPLIRSFFELFGTSIYLHDNIMGSPIANHIYNFMVKLPTFKESAHLADGLNYEDWRNAAKYIPRIRNKTTWVNHLGIEKLTKPVIIIAPSGSHKDTKRQRYITPEEYKRLTNKYLSNHKVYAVGSVNDLHYFGMINKENFSWLTSDKLYHGNGKTESSNLKHMLRIIHGAKHVFSMDTWLKTYTLLCDIPTTVIQTRWNNNYKSYGEDVTDWIFLNPSIWPKIKTARVQDLF